MTKALLITFLLVLMVSGFVLADTLHFVEVKASADVNGIISSDTTWTKANSPYTLTGDLLVSNGVTLTIEAGTTVNLHGFYIMVNGTLSAQGTSTQQIKIDGAYGFGKIIFTQSSTSWNDQTGKGSIIENAYITGHPEIDINYASPKINLNNIASANIVITSGSPIISNCVLAGGDQGPGGSGHYLASEFAINQGSPKILSNTFNVTHIDVKGGSPVISNNVFIGYTFISAESGTVHLGGGGIQSTGGNPYIYSNTFTNCSNPISINDGVVERNYLYGNGFGVKVGNGTVQSNTFVNDGIYVYGSSNPIIVYNNFQSGTARGISLQGTANDVNATYNWWGTTDTATIDNLIEDYNDDFALGRVIYTPFLSAANPDAMPSSAPGSSAPDGFSSTPEIPEFALWIIFAAMALVATALVATFALKRRARSKPPA